MDSSNPRPPHMVLFPFMSKGHTIPLLDLAHLLLRQHVAVTIFTTPANLPFISNSLSDTTATIVDPSFPPNIPGVPPGIESTDKLPSLSFFAPFTTATKLMQPHFEKALQTLPPFDCIISDGFLGWTVESSIKFNVPRLVFYGMNCYSMTVSRAVDEYQLLGKPKSDDELFTVTPFPWIKLCRNDFDETVRLKDHKGPYSEFFMDAVISTSKSYGIVANSFSELESVFLDYWNQNFNPRVWCVGPLCLAKPPSKPYQEKPTWLQWLDRKLSEGRSVLYVAFGTQAAIPAEQFREIAIGLEKSNVNFLWIVRTKPGMELEDGFEERVKEKGTVVREWVDQRVILEHDSVKGFLSHCGWNSVMESICAKVPILAWPMMAEQHLNARMVVEEIKIGLRVETVDGTVRGFVKWEELEKMVKELMEGQMGINVRKKVKELGDMARKAMEEGGSSGKTFDLLVNDVVCAEEDNNLK